MTNEDKHSATTVTPNLGDEAIFLTIATAQLKPYSHSARHNMLYLNGDAMGNLDALDPDEEYVLLIEAASRYRAVIEAQNKRNAKLEARVAQIITEHTDDSGELASSIARMMVDAGLYTLA